MCGKSQTKGLGDVKLDLDDKVVAAIRQLAERTGIKPEEWARLALMSSYLGQSLNEAEKRSRSRQKPE